MTGAKNTRPDNLKSARLKIWRGTSHDTGEFENFDLSKI